MAKCPAHDDKSPSLSVRETEDGRVLIHCHAGCGASDVLAAIGLTLADLFPEARGHYFAAKPHREPENLASSPTYHHLQRQIDVLRAKLTTK